MATEKTPTYDETCTSLMTIIEIASRGLRDLGKIKNEFGSEKELRTLVLDISKKLVQSLPSYQMERDDIDHAEAVLSTILNRASNEEMA